MPHAPISSVDVWVHNANNSGTDVISSNDIQPGGGHDDQYYDEQQYSQGAPSEYCNAGVFDGQERYSNSLPDIQMLANFCAQAHPPEGTSEEDLLLADESWDPVRDWMRTHSAEDVHAATGQRDESGKAALHFACQNAPPIDVIDAFLSIATDVVQWPDQFGWLPIHYACAYGASTHVIKGLAEAFPGSRTAVDRKGRTPLHFALGTINPHPAAVVMILSSTGAATYSDDNGMLPLHYACAYGATEDCLSVLTDAHIDAVTSMDRKGRTPLHFTLSNAARPAAASAVRLLLGLNRSLVDPSEGSPSPVRVLAEFAMTVPAHQREQRESCRACLRHLVGAHPTPTADFFTALQALPKFLQEKAVVMKAVQEMLNFKIAQRFSTLILMLDFYVQMMVVVYYYIAVQESVDYRFLGARDDHSVDLDLLVPLYVGASYFLLREIINFLSLLTLGAFKSWAYEPGTWLNLLYVTAIYFWSIHMNRGSLDRNVFRTGAAISILIIWTKFLAFLRNVLIDFAVFIGGVFHVMRRLAAFLVCLTIILVAFSRMFATMFRQSKYCQNNPVKMLAQDDIINDLQCGQLEIHPWCDGWDSFLAVYTMLLGEVDETKFEDNLVATALFVIFMFLVVILLANVLIAIVTDSYKVIQDQRAAIVFWTNRLNFIAQMDAIANGPWMKLLRKALGIDDSKKALRATGDTDSFGKEYWKHLMKMFEDDFDARVYSLDCIPSSLMRIVALFVVIPAWIVLGICTGGWFWPQPIREFVFTSTVTKHNSESEREEELRVSQLVKVKAEIVAMGEELRQELALDRTQIIQTKSLVAEQKMEIQAEMKHIKRAVTMLFEQIGGG